MPVLDETRYCTSCHKVYSESMGDNCISCASDRTLHTKDMQTFPTDTDNWSEELQAKIVAEDESKRQKKKDLAAIAAVQKQDIEEDPLDYSDEEENFDPENMDGIANPLVPYYGNNQKILAARARNELAMNKPDDEDNDEAPE